MSHVTSQQVDAAAWGRTDWEQSHGRLDIEDMKYNLQKAKLYVLDHMVNNVRTLFGHSPGPRPLEGVTAIELGCGTGTVSLLLAQLGARVTLVDYSPTSLRQAERLFRHYRLLHLAEFVERDLCRADLDIPRRFHLSHSWGVIEHFRQRCGRDQVIRHHMDLLREPGLSFIEVPQRGCVPLAAYLRIKRIQYWMRGQPLPANFAQHLMSRREFTEAVEPYGGTVRMTHCLGSPIYESYLPWVLVRNKRIRRTRQWTKIRPPRRTWLDPYLGYGIFLTFQKQCSLSRAA